MKKLKKILKKIKAYLLISWYTLFFYQPKIKEKWILIDSKNGKDLGSNLLRIAEELSVNPEYRDYHVFISAHKTKKREIRGLCQKNHLQKATLVKHGNFRYAKIAALAKFVFTDTTMPLWYTKKEGQIFTNTWHGTPLKMMGHDVGNRAFDMGNVQKSQLIADYLLYPSDYMKDIMVSAYFLDHLYTGKILCSGYPRNSVFFHPDRAEKLREELHLTHKKVYGYMPTWRGVLKKIDSAKMTDHLEYYFDQLDQNLADDEVFLVRLHPFVANSIDYSRYKHIRVFPKGYEPYDILNLCDCMVTDYSSVFFDYANSGKKIILFVYDREFYLNERGVYVSIDTFPFPQVRTVKQLLAEMRAPKAYDDSEFRKKFCQYDDSDTPAKVCRHIVKGEKAYEELTIPQNGKDNVLVYVGSLAKNGLTTAFFNLMANVDRDKRNYIVTFRSPFLKNEPERIESIPEDMPYIPVASIGCQSLGEGMAIRKYYFKNKINPSIRKKLDRFYSRLYQRNFGFCDIDCVIHYSGYEKDVINMFQCAPVKKMIYVHNDMIAEMNTRQNQHRLTLEHAYGSYDKVVPVTQDIYASTYELGQKEENIQVANNCHDYKAVLEKSKADLHFDRNTQCNFLENDVKEILNGPGKKFITIGRFSPEKGHSMLLKAFDQYWKENPDSYLIIIGGHGVLYADTLGLAGGLASSSHIVIIQSILNPMPILKKCDLFVLSSLYEGLGLVLLEADTLGIPAISTDIVGPRGFMQEHGGYMVPPTVKGLYEGMCAFKDGKVKAMHVDYEVFNQHSVEQFEALFQ